MFLFVVVIVPLCAMENKKDNVISDADLLARKKAFGLAWINRQTWKVEYLNYPKGSNIRIDVKKLNEELGLEEAVTECRDYDQFIVPEGMPAEFIHKTVIPKRISDFEVDMIQ